MRNSEPTELTQIIKSIKNNHMINSSIRETLQATPNILWTVEDIHECVFDILRIDLDVGDNELFNVLLNYFNLKSRHEMTENGVTFNRVFCDYSGTRSQVCPINHN